MKFFTAIVRHEKFGNVSHITREYETKKAFKEDLKGNGIIVLNIYTWEQIEKVKLKNRREIFTHEEEYIQQIL